MCGWLVCMRLCQAVAGCRLQGQRVQLQLQQLGSWCPACRQGMLRVWCQLGAMAVVIRLHW